MSESRAIVERFEALLAAGQDNALLRLTLGQHYLKLDQPCEARTHLLQALELQPGLAAGWKFLGKAQALLDNVEAARSAYQRGIEVAGANGDKQLEKEMRVFLKRLDKIAAGKPPAA